ncbi:unnamed protein product [Euphydryas editha]|uniref:DUF7869 domain-containing protein n=1 Tax=Euphydryas editha TaxID=104508 RepID=A0AAU9U4Q9_EUPED|nr:unnamed protein product [Euphydryas editha]
MNELVNIIDENIFDNLEVAKDSDTANLETPHPSPSCTINHLDYDCDNDFCPYYIQKENLSAFDILPQPSPACISSCLAYTTMSNSPISDISNNSPTTSDRRHPSRKDKGNVRKRHYKEWIDNKRKCLRNLGKEYMSRKGKIQANRKMGPPCRCRKKCFDKLSEEQRKKIFQSFWSLGDREKQWMYVANLVKKQNKRRVYTDTVSRRKHTFKYSIPVGHSKDHINYVDVCKKYFLSTLSVSDQVIYKALEKMDTTTGVLVPDQRGRHSNHPVKKTVSVISSVCDHIKSLQPVESHYTRQRSNKLYLDGDLNFLKLFEMYNEWLQANTYEEKAETERQYRDIVNDNFKLSFYVPKKDQCDQCHIFRNIDSPTEQQITDHEIHVTNKKLSRQIMKSDKNDSKSSQGKIVAATFDFQKILNAPHGQLSVLYYKRKLSVFNFTLFDLANKEGHCYMWHEGEAKRGSNEVSSCLSHFIQKMHQQGAREFRFWSDNCAGQNRNRIVFAFYVYIAHKLNITIKHTFLEKGHTQAEGDSVHALIERSSKNKLIYTPLEWFSLVRWAKQDGKPYNVIEMKHTDFYNFKHLLDGRNWSKNISGDVVKWNKIKEVRICAEDPFKIEYRYDLANSNAMTIAINTNTRRRQRTSMAELCPLYSNHLPLTKAKYDDLMSLCQNGIIPATYHDFFKSLSFVAGSHNVEFSDLE